MCIRPILPGRGARARRPSRAVEDGAGVDDDGSVPDDPQAKNATIAAVSSEKAQRSTALPVADVEDLRCPVHEGPVTTGGGRGAERDRVLVVGDDVVDLVRDRPVARALHHGRAKLGLASARLGAADLVPDDVVGHEGVHDRHLLVGLRHVLLVHRLHRAADQGHVRVLGHGVLLRFAPTAGATVALPGPSVSPGTSGNSSCAEHGSVMVERRCCPPGAMSGDLKSRTCCRRARRPRARSGSSPRSSGRGSSRSDSWRGTPGDSPPRSRTPAPRGSRS